MSFKKVIIITALLFIPVAVMIVDFFFPFLPQNIRFYGAFYIVFYAPTIFSLSLCIND